MNNELLSKWTKAKQATQRAESWNALPSGPKYQRGNDRFHISIDHCRAPMLMRCGQQSCGGKNHWETEDAFNQAILEYTVKNWETIYPEVLAIMKDKENKALQECQSFVTLMQEQINQSKENPSG